MSNHPSAAAFPAEFRARLQHGITTQRMLCGILGFSTILYFAVSIAEAAARPNILLIYTDDMD